MRLYLIRHGESENNKLVTSGGHWEDRVEDPALTELGEKQALLLAEHLASRADNPVHMGGGYAITHLYCSAMLRAMQTTQPVAEALGLRPTVWLDIHEIGGIFREEQVDGERKVIGLHGLTRSQMQARFANYILPDAITETGWWQHETGRETPAQFLSRALRVALMLKERARSDEHIALVVHGAFMDAVLKALLNLLPAHPEQLFFGHYNTGITRVDFNVRNGHDHIALHYINRVDHLPDDCRSW